MGEYYRLPDVAAKIRAEAARLRAAGYDPLVAAEMAEERAAIQGEHKVTPTAAGAGAVAAAHLGEPLSQSR